MPKLIHDIKPKNNKNEIELSFIKKVKHFVQYHNAFVLILIFVVGFGSAIFASEDLRNNVVGQKIVEEYGIDNSFLLAIDLDNYDLAMQITDILEDENYYYIHYQHKAIIIENGVWKEVIKKEVLRVEKESDRYDDLGLYVAEQLSEVADSWINVLKTAQKEAQEQGLTQKIVTTKYTGLIGRFLSPEEKVFEGYQPVVVQPPEEMASQPQIVGEYTPSQLSEQTSQGGTEGPASAGASAAEQPTAQKMPVDRELIRQIVQEILAQQQTQPPAEQPPAETPPAEDICDATHLNLCSTESDCQTAGGVWDSENNVCNSKPEPQCDSEHLDLCATQELCEGASLYWYNDVCNLEPQACTPDWQCDEWDKTLDTVACGETFTQTRICNDGCGNEKTEEQEVIGTQDCPTEDSGEGEGK